MLDTMAFGKKVSNFRYNQSIFMAINFIGIMQSVPVNFNITFIKKRVPKVTRLNQEHTSMQENLHIVYILINNEKTARNKFTLLVTQRI